MADARQHSYLEEVRRVAAQLGLPQNESAVIDHCLLQIDEWVDAHGMPPTLTELLTLAATSLNVEFVEIAETDDIERLLSTKDLNVINAVRKLDDQTDAVTVRRSSQKSWELPYLGLINCQGWHAHRRYFSKWHELVHCMLEGQQLRMALRRTPIASLRRNAEERLVDQIAGALAFYAPIFDPVVQRALESAGGLSFAVIDRIRDEVASEASREATILACIRRHPDPVWFVRFGEGLKKSEERLLSQEAFPGMEPRIERKLRVRSVIGSPATNATGVRFYKNMRVPDESIVARVTGLLGNILGTGNDRLDIWETSADGPIGFGTIKVEATQVQDGIWALLSAGPDVSAY